MAKAAAWFEDQRRQHLSMTVRYYQAGFSHPITCSATLVVGKWDAISQAGQVVRVETRDFLISSDDLPDEPKRGDTIVLVEGGSETTYRVIVPEGGQKEWRWTDRSNRLRRIHTMETERH